MLRCQIRRTHYSRKIKIKSIHDWKPAVQFVAYSAIIKINILSYLFHIFISINLIPHEAEKYYGKYYTTSMFVYETARLEIDSNLQCKGKPTTNKTEHREVSKQCQKYFNASCLNKTAALLHTNFTLK